MQPGSISMRSARATRDRTDEANRRQAVHFVLLDEHADCVTTDLKSVDNRFRLIIRGDGHGEIHVLSEAGNGTSGHRQAADDGPFSAYRIKIGRCLRERRFSLLDGGPG